jgi:hypothetical protein
MMNVIANTTPIATAPRKTVRVVFLRGLTASRASAETDSGFNVFGTAA